MITLMLLLALLSPAAAEKKWNALDVPGRLVLMEKVDPSKKVPRDQATLPFRTLPRVLQTLVRKS